MNVVALYSYEFEGGSCPMTPERNSSRNYVSQYIMKRPTFAWFFLYGSDRHFKFVITLTVTQSHAKANRSQRNLYTSQCTQLRLGCKPSSYKLSKSILIWSDRQSF